MQELFAARTRILAGLATLVCQASILLVLTHGSHAHDPSYVARLVAGGGFLTAASVVFAAWAVTGPTFGLPAAAVALAVGAATGGVGFGLIKALGLAVPVAAAVAYRHRLLKIQNSLRRRDESVRAELAELEERGAQEQAKITALDRRVDRTPMLRETCHALGDAIEKEDVYAVTVQEAIKVMADAHYAVLFLRDEDGEALEPKAVHPEPAEPGSTLCPVQEADRLVFERGTPYLCARTSGDVLRFAEGEPGNVASFASAPIWLETASAGRESKRECVGVLRVSSETESAFSRSDIEVLNIVATLAGMSLQNAGLYERCKELAISDSLTGLYSPHYFRERFREELGRTEREQLPLSFLMMDLDNFKTYNDTFGHPAGDRVLRRVAEVLRAESQAGDILVRYGGEEFAAFRQTDYEGAQAWAERIRAGMERSQPANPGGAPPVTISIGVSTFPAHGAGTEEIIAYADRALYRAKAAGRNQVC